MSKLATAQSLKELKSIYRKLAAIHHPDRGGCLQTMQRLNDKYEQMQTHLKLAANDPRNNDPVYYRRSACSPVRTAQRKPKEDFSTLKVGDTIYVNNTLCDVLGVAENSFRVQAVGRTRQSVFDKKTGIGVFNRRLRASHFRSERRQYH